MDGDRSQTYHSRTQKNEGLGHKIGNREECDHFTFLAHGDPRVPAVPIGH